MKKIGDFLSEKATLAKRKGDLEYILDKMNHGGCGGRYGHISLSAKENTYQSRAVHVSIDSNVAIAMFQAELKRVESLLARAHGLVAKWEGELNEGTD